MKKVYCLFDYSDQDDDCPRGQLLKICGTKKLAKYYKKLYNKGPYDCDFTEWVVDDDEEAVIKVLSQDKCPKCKDIIHQKLDNGWDLSYPCACEWYEK